MSYTNEQLNIVLPLHILLDDLKEIERDWNLGKISTQQKRNEEINATKLFIESINDKLSK